MTSVTSANEDWERQFRIQLDFVQAKNMKKDVLECYTILVKIYTNIINNPHDKKFKTIRERGKTIQKVWQCHGGSELIHRFAKKTVKDFEACFEFGNVPGRVPLIINEYIQVVQKQLIQPNPKEEERLYKEKILRDIEQDRLERLERLERQRHQHHS